MSDPVTAASPRLSLPPPPAMVLQMQHFVAQHLHQRNTLFFAMIANGINQLHPL
jgi:hypothetical protein